MDERVKRLTEEIRKLPPEEQAVLIDELLVLTNRDADPEIEKAWFAEAERRLAAYRTGEVEAVPVADVMARLRKRSNPTE